MDFKENTITPIEGSESELWVKKVVNDDDYGREDNPFDEFGYRIQEKRIRVKHLDREDIESLGFKHIQIEWDKVSEERRYSKDNYSLLFYSYSISEQNKHLRGSVTIYYRTGDFDGEVIFDGIIKNKSELKKLLKQLGV